MELINATDLLVEHSMGLDTSGRERTVVVIKGTFKIVEGDGEPVLADEQVPHIVSDQFWGEPGLTPTQYESDFVPFKPRCDVLLHGSAYAPESRPTTRVRVALNVGTMLKGFDVVGDRVWAKPTLGFKVAGKPLPFVSKPISYDRAFGGIDVHPDEPDKVKSYSANPIGVGYYPYAGGKELEGRPLPNTAEIDVVPDSPKGNYKPMAFGPIGRNFRPRDRFAGSYDEQWLEEVFPFLPSDFNPAYFQSAPQDQQIPYPQGGEMVVLRNLTPTGRTTFRLPSIELPVEFVTRGAGPSEARAVLDTITIEPDSGRFIVAWRASQFLRRSLNEVKQIVVGTMPQAWYQKRDIKELPKETPSPVVLITPPATEPAQAPPAPLSGATEVSLPPPSVPPAASTKAPTPMPRRTQIESTPPAQGRPIVKPSPAVKPAGPADSKDRDEGEDLVETQIWEPATYMVRQHTTPIVQLGSEPEGEEDLLLTATTVWESSPGLVEPSTPHVTTSSGDIDLTETMMEWPTRSELERLDHPDEEGGELEPGDVEQTLLVDHSEGELDLTATMVELPANVRQLLDEDREVDALPEGGDLTDTLVEMPSPPDHRQEGAPRYEDLGVDDPKGDKTDDEED